ncbi:hypothetical protein, partial [Candidatus Paracaedibacter symbiosus]|uniref:hypothetical protein n=1 Tax=Candidatus Paracaedibacter symbiosus TaxID=244582 RepID=UPI000509EE68
ALAEKKSANKPLNLENKAQKEENSKLSPKRVAKGKGEEVLLSNRSSNDTNSHSYGGTIGGEE